MYEFLCFNILLMEEILHHLGCIKPYGYWDIYYINWLAEFLNHQAVRGCFELFTDHAGLERLSKWAQKKNAALMLSASQLVFFHPGGNRTRRRQFLSFRTETWSFPRNAPMFLRQRNGPPKAQQLSCLKNRGVPWQNSRLWQKKTKRKQQVPSLKLVFT